jgi:hypothetical protein
MIFSKGILKKRFEAMFIEFFIMFPNYENNLKDNLINFMNKKNIVW